jgi:hypothetical protein
MFTIKYRMTDGRELITGGFDVVSSYIEEFLPKNSLSENHPDNRDKLHLRVVTGNLADGSTVTYGPVYHLPDDGAALLQAVVWVMNEQGATVARYDLT